MKKEKILYVDDEIINLQLFEINFSDKYEVLTVDRGMKGLDILDNNPEIMIIISDMKMPNMNGLEFIKEAKRKHPNKKYFLLTGFEITAEIRTALESKLILKYFSKPFNIDEIQKTITNAI